MPTKTVTLEVLFTGATCGNDEYACDCQGNECCVAYQEPILIDDDTGLPTRCDECLAEFGTEETTNGDR